MVYNPFSVWYIGVYGGKAVPDVAPAKADVQRALKSLDSRVPENDDIQRKSTFSVNC
jgi:hypothetical protein